MSNDSPEYASITADQELLFPESVRELCQEIRLDQWATAKLHGDGWLSFDPEQPHPYTSRTTIFAASGKWSRPVAGRQRMTNQEELSGGISPCK